LVVASDGDPTAVVGRQRRRSRPWLPCFPVAFVAVRESTRRQWRWRVEERCHKWRWRVEETRHYCSCSPECFPTLLGIFRGCFVIFKLFNVISLVSFEVL
jgi:hypothetical protein